MSSPTDQIEYLKSCGMGPQEIADQLGIPLHYVENVMHHYFVVASATKPKAGQETAFINAIKGIAADLSAPLLGILIVPSNGCNNYGLLLGADTETPGVERFLNMVTMALMPARWSSSVPHPDLQPGVWEVRL